MRQYFVIAVLFSLLLIFAPPIFAQITPVGSGSYTTQFPGTDEAGRNGFPSGTPQLSGNAVGKPVPTNDWWSSVIKNDHVSNLFNYPMALKTKTSGLVVSYIPWGVYDDQEPIIIGVSNLNASMATVSDYSDWTVTMDWSTKFQSTAGIAMPFIYFSKGTAEVAQITVNLGNVTVDNEMILITDARNGADFAVYGPVGSTWTQNGSVYTSTLNGENYWSMAMLPQDIPNPATIADEYKKYAYVFPTTTTVDWNYDESQSKVRTNFVVATEIKEGTDTNLLIGLLPHQWDNLASDSPQPNEYTYNSIRGEIKTMAGNSFSVENTFSGILPTLPYLSNYSDEFSPSVLNQKVEQIQNDGLSTWTDSYNEGQVMNRLIQTARIADETGNIEARDKMIATVKERLEDWLTAEASEVAFLFYYNSTWSALLGYPAGHGQDTNINDHHFHWGYFIHAAAFIEQFEPGWANQWGEMVNYLVRDAASPDHSDSEFPFLRNFSPYAGHCWANGFASFPQGNDQESTSESMQFNSSLIHWGTITGNNEIRDLGIYLYTTEQTAVEEYWFDMNERNFGPSQQYSLVSRVWGNSYDNGTFWTSDIAASYGIELYPVHGGSMYLGHNIPYAEKLWAEIESNTGILSNEANDNLWHDIMWQYLAFTDPVKAIQLYNSYPDRNLKFGVSDAQTYYWLHSMNAMGKVEASVTADYPIAVVFNSAGQYTYVAHNYTNSPITVNFSDGFTLDVPANSMATNRDVNIEGTLSSSFASAYPGGSIELTLSTASIDVTKVEFYQDGLAIGEVLTAPYVLRASQLGVGVHDFYAKMYEGDAFDVSNIISVQVGRQLPYLGDPVAIPGTIEAGNYDKFEGGLGQNISYFDVSLNNEGDYRPEEAVDAQLSTSEGATVGWINSGEYLEYTINAASSGLYDVSFRFASGNQSGGGPFHFELDDQRISDDISLTYTSDWNSWQSKTVSDLAIPEGEHILKLVFDSGEFNIGRMTFSYVAELAYSVPVADAGQNVVVIMPATTAELDGSGSSDADNDPLTFTWEQVNGPSVIAFSDNEIASPAISNLEEGIYTCKLTVSDGQYSSSATTLVIVSETGNSPPTVSINTPLNNSSHEEGNPISITASASDLEGEVTLVEFFDGTVKLGEDNTQPYNFEWVDAAVGAHVLTAKATDNQGLSSTSQVINISVDEVKECVVSSNEAQQGSFSVGYKASYRTVGTDVTVTFELLDLDKVGVVAFLWQQTPFSETQMENVSGNIFTKKLSGLTPGSTISYACKFAFAGGLSVTKYISYEVGSDCSGTADTTPPDSFTASLGTVTRSSIAFQLQANDASGTISYQIAYGAITEATTAASGESITFVINSLNPETQYTFSITASDLAGNIALNSPIVITETTSVDTNTACSGTDYKALLGAFEVGYTYDFKTDGTDVILTFELLDQRNDVFAFLWKETPFTETAMTKVSGQKYTATISNQSPGTTISYACKFEFAGGLAVTKYFSYEVGVVCDNVLSIENGLDANIQIYPNPVRDILTVDWNGFERATVYTLAGQPILVSDNREIQLADLPEGMYVLLLISNDGQQFHRRIMKK